MADTNNVSDKENTPSLDPDPVIAGVQMASS